ncbi:MAG: Rrf2 family transcriptional regulator [Saprospiraceae bacterium]
MKVLSKACVYGLRALIYMASMEKTDTYMSIRTISEDLDISFHFLTKTFQSLTENGILKSYRGPSGGVAFAKPIQDILLIDIIEIIEGEDFFSSCLLGLAGCGEAVPCPVHNFWKVIRNNLKVKFEVTSLSELAAKFDENSLRLKE